MTEVGRDQSQLHEGLRGLLGERDRLQEQLLKAMQSHARLTDAERVAPPSTIASTPPTAERTPETSVRRSADTTTTTPSEAAAAETTARARTAIPDRSANCLSPPKRVPLPAATTTVHVLTGHSRSRSAGNLLPGVLASMTAGDATSH